MIHLRNVITGEHIIGFPDGKNGDIMHFIEFNKGRRDLQWEEWRNVDTEHMQYTLQCYGIPFPKEEDKNVQTKAIDHVERPLKCIPRKTFNE